MGKWSRVAHRWPVLVALSTVAVSLYVAGFFPHHYEKGRFVTDINFDLQTGGGNRAVLKCTEPTACARTLSSRLSHFQAESAVELEGDSVVVETALDDETLQLLSSPGSLTASLGGEELFFTDDVAATEPPQVVQRSGRWLYVLELELSPSASEKLAEATENLEENGDFLESPLRVEIDGISLLLNIPSEVRGEPLEKISIGGAAPSREKAERNAALLYALLSHGEAAVSSRRVERLPPSLSFGFLPAVAFLLVLESALLYRLSPALSWLGPSASLALLLFSQASLAFFSTTVDLSTLFSWAVPLTMGLHLSSHLWLRGGMQPLVRRSAALFSVGLFLFLTGWEGPGVVVASTSLAVPLFAPAVREALRTG